MSRRKGEDTPAKKRRRLPHVAVIERSDPFLAADRQQLEDQCFRITNGREFFVTMRWQDDRDVHVVHFAEPHQAKSLEEWIRQTRFYARPKPYYGPTQEERAAFEQEALAWGARTGALRAVVQAYRRRSLAGGSIGQCQTAAEQMLRRHLLPDGHGHYNVATVLVSWAMREHTGWFFGLRRQANGTGNEPDFPPPDAYPHSEE